MAVVNELEENAPETANAGLRNTWYNYSIIWAVACALLVLLWQFATVHYNYSGNPTALFCTGANPPIPASLESENIYRYPNPNGWDGQTALCLR